MTITAEGVARWTRIAEQHVQGIEGKGPYERPSGKCGYFWCRLPWPCCWAEGAREMLAMAEAERKAST